MRLITRIILLAGATCLSVSCMMKEKVSPFSDGSTNVDIEISTGSDKSATRAPADGGEGLEYEQGNLNESRIATLDVLVFKHKDDGTGGYLYRRQAVSLGGNKYRVQLKESTAEMDIHLFANCRDAVDRWVAANPKADETTEGDKWSVVQLAMTFTSAEATALINGKIETNDDYVSLPMYNGQLKGVALDPTKSPNTWPTNANETIKLRRAVASVDLYVQKGITATERFKLNGLFAWYAPNAGYPGEMVDTTLPTYQIAGQTVQQYLIPDAMRTNLTATEGVWDAGSSTWTTNPVLHANKVSPITASNGKNYDGIDYQIYVYENYSKSWSNQEKRPTRVIMSGMYMTDPAVVGTGTPSDPQFPAKWKKAYYPIDLTENDGSYRPLIRNCKYELTVVAVTGPGYDNLADAASGAPIHLNTEVIWWNKDDVQIGVKGKYYVTMDEREVTLWRNANNYKTVGLSYVESNDGEPGTFEIQFTKNAHVGDPVVEKNGTITTTTIKNDYFQVKMVQDSSIGKTSFTITALQEYSNEANARETFIVKFRDLQFEVGITQLPKGLEDWNDGGDQDWQS